MNNIDYIKLVGLISIVINVIIVMILNHNINNHSYLYFTF